MLFVSNPLRQQQQQLLLLLILFLSLLVSSIVFSFGLITTERSCMHHHHHHYHCTPPTPTQFFCPSSSEMMTSMKMMNDKNNEEENGKPNNNEENESIPKDDSKAETTTAATTTMEKLVLELKDIQAQRQELLDILEISSKKKNKKNNKKQKKSPTSNTTTTTSSTTTTASEDDWERTKQHLSRMELRHSRQTNGRQSPSSTSQQEEEERRMQLYDQFIVRSANDLKTELNQHKLKENGRKPELARRLVDYYISIEKAQQQQQDDNDEADDDDNDDELTHIANEEKNEEEDIHHPEVTQIKSFAGLKQLHPVISNALTKAGFHTPSPVQKAAVRSIYTGSDCILHAETGSGKTLAYLIPLMERFWRDMEQHGESTSSSLSSSSNDKYALILTPTRELASQVAGVASVLAPRGSVRLISTPTNLLSFSHADKERGEIGPYNAGRRSIKDRKQQQEQEKELFQCDKPHIFIGSAKCIYTSLFGLGDTYPVPPTSKPQAKELLRNIEWIVLDEVDRILNVKKNRMDKRSSHHHYHEKPAAVITAAIARSTLGRAQIIGASATIGRPLRREICRVLGLPTNECPSIIRGNNNNNEDNEDDGSSSSSSFVGSGGRIVRIPSSVQNYVIPVDGSSSGSLLTSASFVLQSLSSSSVSVSKVEEKKEENESPKKTTKRKVLVVLTRGCGLTVGNALGALRHFGCDPEPQSLLDVLEADGTDHLMRVHQEVSGATGLGESSLLPSSLSSSSSSSSSSQENDNNNNNDDNNGYTLITGEDSVRGLHLDGLNTVIIIGRPHGPDEYTHIAGRTGRAGHYGNVINVVSYEQAAALTSWEKMLGVDFIPLNEEEIASIPLKIK